MSTSSVLWWFVGWHSVELFKILELWALQVRLVRNVKYLIVWRVAPRDVERCTERTAAERNGTSKAKQRNKKVVGH
jgi:hypothetical protein